MWKVGRRDETSGLLPNIGEKEMILTKSQDVVDREKFIAGRM